VPGATKFGTSAFFIDVLLHGVLPNCHFNKLGVPPDISKDLKGAANKKG
jgi:hypothetical protein